MEFTITIIPIFLAIVFIFAVVGIASYAKRQAAQQREIKRQRDNELDAESRRRREAAARAAAETKRFTSSITIPESDDHEHIYDIVENYDEIYGSLGPNTDEGCTELAGIRLLSNDEAYDTDDGAATFDLNKVTFALVLGSMLDKPKGKR
jgi:hypothetical protein